MNRNTRLSTRLTALAALVLLPLLGCGSSEGTLTVLLTDAPGDFKKAVVTIDQIYLQGDSGRVVLSEEKTTTDLLTLANDTDTLVQDAVVPEGTYGQLRFVISGAYIEVENADGTTSIYASSPDYEGLPEGAQVAGSLQMPSFAQSGLKVNLPGDQLTITGEQKILLVDFDVSQSFGQRAGNSGQWVMTPVLQASEVQATGSVQLTLAKEESVTLPGELTLGDFKVALTNAAGTREELPLADADANGVFEARFQFLLPGTYSADLVLPEGLTGATTSPARPATVTVESGKDGTLAFTLQAVQ